MTESAPEAATTPEAATETAAERVELEPIGLFKQRLQREGRWEEFRARRDILQKRHRLDITMAWEFAARGFPPLDGSPHLPLDVGMDWTSIQDETVEDVAGHLKQQMNSIATQAADRVVGRIANEATAAIAPEVQALAEERLRQAKAKTEAAIARSRMEEARARMVSARAAAAEAEAQTPDEEEQWEMLASMAADVVASERAIAQWVFDSVAVPLADLLASSVPPPSKGAVGLLMWVRSSDSAKSEFYRNIWPKLFPNRTQMGKDDQPKDAAGVDDIDRMAESLLETLGDAADPTP